MNQNIVNSRFCILTGAKCSWHFTLKSGFLKGHGLFKMNSVTNLVIVLEKYMWWHELLLKSLNPWLFLAYICSQSSGSISRNLQKKHISKFLGRWIWCLSSQRLTHFKTSSQVANLSKKCIYQKAAKIRWQNWQV